MITNEGAKRLASMIIYQAVHDFKHLPNQREEVQKFFESDWGEELLDALEITYDEIEAQLNMDETIKKHKRFLRDLDTLRKAGEDPTIKELANMLGWEENETYMHCKEYGIKLLDKRYATKGGRRK